jgi:hypothetical protein
MLWDVEMVSTERPVESARAAFDRNPCIVGDGISSHPYTGRRACIAKLCGLATWFVVVH